MSLDLEQITVSSVDGGQVEEEPTGSVGTPVDVVAALPGQQGTKGDPGPPSVWTQEDW